MEKRNWLRKLKSWQIGAIIGGVVGVVDTVITLVKEELWRSVAVFFFALIFVSFLITKFGMTASFFTVIIAPLLITISHFLIKIYIRKGEPYKPKKLSAKTVAEFLASLSLIFIILGLMGISLRGEASNESLILLGICPFLLVVSLIWCYKLKGVK